MKWFLVVYFLVNGEWIEAGKLNKEGWWAVEKESKQTCLEKMNFANNNLKRIADYRQIVLDTKFECEQWDAKQQKAYSEMKKNSSQE